MKNTNNTQIKSPVLTGFVSQFNAERHFGIVIIDGHARSYNLSTKNGPYMVSAGKRMPFFNGQRAKNLPSVTDAVVVVLSKEAGKMKVTHWGHAADWQKAESLIARRAQTHGARSAQFMKKFRSAVTVTTTGTAESADPNTVVETLTPKPLRTTILSNACMA